MSALSLYILGTYVTGANNSGQLVVYYPVSAGSDWGFLADIDERPVVRVQAQRETCCGQSY